MSPFGWYAGSASNAVVGSLDKTGYLHYYSVAYGHGLRPVISLKSCVQYNSGDGTASNPYTVKLTDTCSTAEN